MKKLILGFVAVATALLSAVSCRQVTPEADLQPDSYIYTATRDAWTRTTLGPDGEVIWSTADAISILTPTGGNATLNVTEVSKGGLQAHFSGSVAPASGNYALSPASSSATISGGKVTVTMPSVQTAVAGSFAPEAAPAIADASSTDLNFRNAGALLGIKVRNSGIVSVRFEATGDGSDSPAGTAQVSWNGGEPTATVTSGASSVTLDGALEAGAEYWISVWPGTYNGLELTFIDAAGREAQYTNHTQLVAVRNDRQHLIDVNIPEGKWLSPAIDAADNVQVPASGVSYGTLDVTLTAADAWDLAVDYDGCISGASISTDRSEVHYSVAANTSTSARTGHLYLSLSRSGFPDVTKTVTVTQEGASAGPVEWTLATSMSQLSAGMKAVIAANAYDKVAGNLSGKLLSSLTATFSSDKTTIESLPDEALILTLGTSGSYWTFADEDGRLLGANAAKSLCWDDGTTTWDITFNAGVMTLSSTNSSCGALQYNSSSPRFLNYTSSQKAIQLYVKPDGSSVTTLSNITDITTSGATLYGSFNCTDEVPTQVGFHYGTSESSMNASVYAPAPSGKTGEFSVTLAGLPSNTTYYYRAFVVEAGTTHSGSVRSFTTRKEGSGGQTGQADYGWFELPAQKDANRDGIDDDNPDMYYSHTFRADAPSIRNFSCGYSKGKIHAVWVAAPMHECYLGGSGRNDSYQDDPNIKCPQSAKFTPYTRGHMLGSSDRTVSVATNKQAFYHSNIGAQIQAGFNTGGGAWNNLESFTDGQLCRDTLYQVIGCIFETFTDRYGQTVTAAKGSNSAGQFQIPTAWYKVLLRTKGGNTGKAVDQCSETELKCAAFILGHYSNAGHKPTSQDLYTVEELEALTGLTFFVNVPNAPKSTVKASEWGL
ncbi:MAG: DNA/RNA non-specific endonuclease [Bacteroidales bacterium]|nr:DNA/RNA non-specific endonuclease [Bacteroidales bacterium]